MNIKDSILEVLEEYKDTQLNIASPVAREELAEVIYRRLKSHGRESYWQGLLRYDKNKRKD
tara:strand:- start:11671 stop:11853 length:183 start_codon:yes stop_codon:yes gene_type:complete